MRVTLFGNMQDKQWRSPSMDRYADELYKGLIKREIITELIEPSLPAGLNFLPSQARYQSSRYVFYPFIAKGRQGDVNHITDHSFGQVAKNLDLNKTIITCHDLIPLHYEKDQFSLKMFQESVSYLSKVRFVLADSNATKHDLIDILGVQEKKIRVVPLGRNETFKRSSVKETNEFKTKYNLGDKPLILHVGNNLEYKNIGKMVDAINIVRSQGHDFTLVKVGPNIEKEMNFDYKHIKFVPESELPTLYSSVDFLLYPSVMEGFGFPTLEALACDTRVVVGKNTSLDEIAGDAGIYVDGKDVASIVRGIVKALEMNKSETEILVKKGLTQSKKFSWDSTVDQVIEVYKEIAGD